MNIIGIDPGLSGAIALISSTGKYMEVYDVVTEVKGKGKIKNQIEALETFKILTYMKLRSSSKAKILIEKVSSMPGQGVASVFSLGDSYGSLRALSTCCYLPVETVLPAKWKKHFKLTSDKDKSLKLARELFPEAPLSRKKDIDRAEALLIARYGWETL